MGFLRICLVLNCLVAIGVLSSTPVDPLTEVAECEPLLHSQFEIPSCPRAGKCYLSAHNKAQECFALEKGSHSFNQCSLSAEVNAARLDVIRLRCLWHRALTGCLMGETTKDFVLPHLPFNEPETKVDLMSINQHQQCWMDVYRTVGICNAAGSNCPNFAICSATDARKLESSHDVNLKKWFELITEVNRLKDIATNTYAFRLKRCLEVRSHTDDL